MTCARCVELEEEIAFLKSELAGETGAALMLQCAFSIYPSEARLLARLYSAKGGLVAHWQILETVDTDVAEPSPDAVKVRIHRLRRRVGERAIENVWGQGYRLTPWGLATIASVLRPRSHAAATIVPFAGERRDA